MESCKFILLIYVNVLNHQNISSLSGNCSFRTHLQVLQISMKFLLLWKIHCNVVDFKASQSHLNEKIKETIYIKCFRQVSAWCLKVPSMVNSTRLAPLDSSRNMCPTMQVTTINHYGSLDSEESKNSNVFSITEDRPECNDRFWSNIKKFRFSEVTVINTTLQKWAGVPLIHTKGRKYGHITTVEPRYNEVLGNKKFTLLCQVSHIGVKKQRNIKKLGPAKLPCYKRVLIYPTSL